MTQLTGSAERRTTHAVPFVAGGLVATALIAGAFLVTLAMGVRLEMPAPVDRQVAGSAVEPRTALEPYDGPLDPVERAYIGAAHRDARVTGAEALSGRPTGATSAMDFGGDIPRWHLVAK